jgi:hypothetical protein
MDKYKKYDEDLDIFPDVSIEPIESITGADSEEEEIETTPQVRREQEDIFTTSVGKKLNKKIEKQPTIAEEEESIIINDEPDVMETIEPKRKGRGKALKKYNAKPRTEKQLAVLEKARLARAKKRELKAGIKMEISPKQEIKEEIKTKPIETAPTIVEVEDKPKIPKNINDFDTFCDFMNRYNTNRKQMGTANSEAHPNKLVNKNLLPRPPLIANEKNKVEKIKKKVAIMEKPTNIYDPMYAINMLTNRGSSRSKFKDPFSR